MYQAIYSKNGDLKHSHECTMSFGRKDHNCPRCLEMLNGSPSRSGWQKSYYKMQKEDQIRDKISFQDHFKNCKACQSGSVCTFGEW